MLYTTIYHFNYRFVRLISCFKDGFTCVQIFNKREYLNRLCTAVNAQEVIVNKYLFDNINNAINFCPKVR